MHNIHEIRAEIDQSRSRYQIERFVIGQHHTLEMQYVQLIRELDTLQNAYDDGLLRIKKMVAEAEELRETGRKSDAIEAEIKERQAASTRLNLEGTKRELEIMYNLLERYPKFTRDDIEDAQEQYWQERLTRVAHMQAMSGSIGWAQIEALWQAGVLDKLLVSDPVEELINTKPLEAQQ